MHKIYKANIPMRANLHFRCMKQVMLRIRSGAPEVIRDNMFVHMYNQQREQTKGEKLRNKRTANK